MSRNDDKTYRCSVIISKLFFAITLMFSATNILASAYENLYSDVKVLVVGVHHFDPSGEDVFNMSVTNIHGAKRQAEIEKLVQRLASFKPTIIALELTPENESAFNKNYHNYLDGIYTLSANERDQLGMRLAAVLGHKKLYAIDAIASWSLEGLNEASVAGKAVPLLRYVLEKKAPNLLASIQDLEDSGVATMTDLLKYLNGDWHRQNHSIYGLLSRVGTRHDHAGAEFAGSWNLRNLKIAANIQDIIKNDNERVLVLFGAAHRLPIERGLMHMGIPTVDPMTEIFQH